MNKKLIKLIILLFCINIFVTTSVKGEVAFGKLAKDGTRLIATYYDPNIQTITANNTVQQGSERILYDNMYLKYQKIFLYFMFSEYRSDELKFTVSYYILNTTMNYTRYELDSKNR